MTQKEKAEQRRREKLADIQDQIKKGTLTVRKMTAKERAEHPPRSGGTSRRRR